MPQTIKKSRYQNTTLRLPRHIYDRAKIVVVRSEASSFNEFVIQAIEEKVQRLSEAEIDAAFAQMALDPDYQRSSIEIAEEFEKSDWEAFKSDTTYEQPKNERAKTRTSKTRSR
jgi:hypothetical protein